MRSPGRFAIIAISLALIVAGVIGCTLAGCAAGRSADGHTVVGFPLGSQAPDGWQDGAVAAGGVIGGIFGGPGGAVLGGSIASVVAGAVGLLLGKKSGTAEGTAVGNATGQQIGWNDRAQHQTEIDAAYDAGRLHGAGAVPPAVAIPPAAPVTAATPPTVVPVVGAGT